MSTFQSFNPWRDQTDDDSMRSLVGRGLNVPLGARRSFALGSPSVETAPASGRRLLGYMPRGSFIRTSHHATPYYFSVGSTSGRGGRLVDQLGSALQEEMPLLQQAADRQFVRNQGPIDDMRALIRRSGEFTAVGERTAQDLTALGERQESDFERHVAGTMSRFDSTYADDVTAAISGIRESMQPTLNAIRSGLTPDGNMLTPAQQKDMMLAVQRQVGSQVQTVATQMASQYNEARAQLGLAFSGQRLGMQQTVGAYNQMAASIRNAATAAALQFEASGNQAVADLIYRNPESVVSRFQGLLALAGVATAPGARNIPAVPA